MSSKALEEIKSEIITFTKEFYSNSPDVAELGDYTPFLYALGEEKWVESQIRQASQHIPTNDPPGGMEDQLLGLIEYYRENKEDWILEICEDVYETIKENYISNGMIVTPYFEWLDYGTKLANSPDKSKWVQRVAKFTSNFTPIFKRIKSPSLVFPRNGVFIEHFVDLYQLTGKEKYLSSAKNLADNYIEWNQFIEYGLFPSPHRLFGLSNEARIFKDNTGLVNGLIAVYETTKEEKYKKAIEKWISSISEKCIRGPVYGRYKFSIDSSNSSKLFYSFSVIDLLCYAYHVLGKEKYLEVAKGIADSWLEKQSELGLFPFEYNGKFSHHDCMTDFTISLYRLWELTGEKRYKKSYEEALDGLFEHQSFNLHVDIKTGNITNENTVPRFVPLEGKIIILSESSEKIYKENDRLFKLLRDR